MDSRRFAIFHWDRLHRILAFSGGFGFRVKSVGVGMGFRATSKDRASSSSQLLKFPVIALVMNLLSVNGSLNCKGSS